MNIYEKLGIAGCVSSIGAIIYSCYVHTKVNEANAQITELNRLLVRKVDGLSKEIPVDVSKELVDLAVEKAVDREVNSAVRNAIYDVVDSTKREIKREVKESVNSVYSDISSSVSKEVSYQVANLDIAKLKAEVKDRAKAMILEKFDGNLDSLLEEFNQSLSNVSKIYNSIADSMSKKKEADTIFRIEH